jgi:hypothetical protein
MSRLHVRIFDGVVERFAMFVIEFEPTFSITRDDHSKEATGTGFLGVKLFDRCIRVGRLRVTRLTPQPGVRIDQRAAGIFLNSQWMPRVVLPVSVATESVEPLLVQIMGYDPSEKIQSFVLKTL